MNKFTLRAGGSSPIIIGVCLLCFLLIGFLGNLSDWYNYHRIDTEGFIIPLLLIIFLGGIFGLYFFIINIKLSSDSLSVFPGNKPFAFSWQSNNFPKNKAISIKLSEISGVFVGQLRELEKITKESKEQSAENALQYWHNTWIPMSSSIPLPMPVWFAAQFSIIMFVRSKDSHSSFVVSLKPFSKRGVLKLLDHFKQRGIQVVKQPNIGLGK